MQFLFLAALGFVIFLSSTASVVMGNIDRPQAAADAKNQVEQYRMFMFASAQYMATQANPMSMRAIPWSAIQAAGTTPPASKTVAMPAGWRVIQATDGAWVACTELDERAIAAVGQMVAAQPLAPASSPAAIPLPIATPTPVTIGQNAYVVIGERATASALAAMCNSS